jgi:hypothetical protein
MMKIILNLITFALLVQKLQNDKHAQYLVKEKVFSYLVLWLSIGDEVNWVGCTFEEVVEKTKCQKMNVNFL